MRNVPGPEAVVAAKLWAREQKRREKAHQKRIGQQRARIKGWIYTSHDMPGMVRLAPETPLEGPLARFIVGEHNTIGAEHELIVDAVDGMTIDEDWEIHGYLAEITHPIRQKYVESAAQNAPRVSSEDDDI